MKVMLTKHDCFILLSSMTLMLMTGCGLFGGVMLEVGRCPTSPVTAGVPVRVDLFAHDLFAALLRIDDASVESSTNAEVAEPEHESAFTFTAQITPLEAGEVEVIFSADVEGFAAELTATCSFVAVDATD